MYHTSKLVTYYYSCCGSASSLRASSIILRASCARSGLPNSTVSTPPPPWISISNRSLRRHFTAASTNARRFSRVTSTSGAGGAVLALTVAKWSVEDVARWVQTIPELERHVATIKRLEVNGRALLQVTEGKLISPPYSLPPGAAVTLVDAVRKLAAFMTLGLPPDAVTRVWTTTELKLVLKEKGLNGNLLPKESSSVPEAIAWLLDAVPQLSLDEVLRLVELKADGKALLRITEDKLRQDGLSRGSAVNIVDALIRLRASRDPLDLVEELTRALPAVKPSAEPDVQWVERIGVREQLAAAFELNRTAFEGPAKERANDYRFISISGGSGSGKTRTGKEITRLLRQELGEKLGFRARWKKVEVCHMLFRPADDSPLSRDYPAGYSATNRPPRQADPHGVQIGEETLALAIAAGVLLERTDRVAQTILRDTSPAFTALRTVVQAIRRQRGLGPNELLVLFPQIDEYQNAGYLTLCMMRAIARSITSQDFFRAECALIVPVLTGTAPADVKHIEAIYGATYYSGENVALSPMTTEQARTMLLNGMRAILQKGGVLGAGIDEKVAPVAKSALLRRLVHSLGGLPTLLLEAAEYLTRNHSLLSANEAARVWDHVHSRAMSNYPPELWIKALGGTREAVLQLIELAHFRTPVRREDKLNGSTVGDIERYGILYLQPLPTPGTFRVSLSLMLLRLLSEYRDLQGSYFERELFRPFERTEANVGFPDLIAAIHKLTYRLLTRLKHPDEVPKLVTVPLRTIYRDCLKGSKDALERTVTVQPGVEVEQCPKYTSPHESGNENIITDWRHVVVSAAGEASKTKEVNFTSGKYIIKARRMAPTADIYTPHAHEQLKWSTYAEDGLPIPEGNDIRAGNVQDELEDDLARTDVEAAPATWNFAIISPRKYKGVPGRLRKDTVLICGTDCLQFLGAFASRVSLPDAEHE